MAGFTMTLLSLTGLLLIFIVLLQRGRGGGLAGAFGGAGGQSAFGTRAGDVFTKITVILAVIWVVLAGATGFAMRAGATKRSAEFASEKSDVPSVESADPEKDEKKPLTDKDDTEKPSKPAATTDEPSKDEAKKDADAEKPATDEAKKDEADKPEAKKPEPKDESAKPESEKKEEPKTEKPEEK
jgi:preprotein translocase subunit SecG